MYIYMYYMYMHTYIHTYIYSEREREELLGRLRALATWGALPLSELRKEYIIVSYWKYDYYVM